MAGKATRQKGNRFEREIVNALRAAGLDALRVPLSGSMRGFKQDVIIRLGDRQLTIEAKSRASGMTFIYQSIQDADLLAIKVDRAEPLIVMRLSEFTRMHSQSERGKRDQPASDPLQANTQSSLVNHAHSIIQSRPSEREGLRRSKG